MNERDSFDLMMERLKEKGDKERETIEVAEELTEIIGTITDARIEKGLTQRDLAEMSGLKQSAIARMESIQAIPRLDTLVKIARCLGITIKAEKKEEVLGSASASIYVLSDYNNSSLLYGWTHPLFSVNTVREGAV